MWQQELKNCICKADQLCKALSLPEEKVALYERIINQYPMRITPYYFSLINCNDPDDPIKKLCVPSEDELFIGGEADTSGEMSNTKQEGVQHKYNQTALILSSNNCAMYCRYCFRKRMVGLTDVELNKRVEEALEYVRQHKEITNVLITGGDAFMNTNQVIKHYLEVFSKVDTLDFIRFGSRVPVTFPSRIYEDKEFLDLLGKYAQKKPIYVITQFNHPREITKESVRAVQALQELGVQVRNQTVLLREVNDTPMILGTLLRELTKIEVVAHYIFQCRPVLGVKKHFQVPLLEASKIVDKAKEYQNGIGKNVRFCMSHPRGKIEIIGAIDNNKMLFKFHQSKSPYDSSKIFSVDLKDDSTWLNDNLCAE